jgi:hypothetical protein
MPRLTKLENVLFPVDEHPVFVSVKRTTGEQRLPVPFKKAVVNRTNGRVLGIVSRDYRLVSNEEALKGAFQCCEAVFPETHPSEWEVKAVDGPATGGHCFMDLVHNSTALDFQYVPAKEKPEVFGPFIRVTNSYNGLRALAFDIGFFRKVCKNGLILPEALIRFKFSHVHRDIGKTIRFEVAHERLTKFKADFEDYLGALRDCSVPHVDFAPFVCGVLSISKPEKLEANARTADEWTTLSAHIGELSDRYAKDLGDNAYAVFNAVTELASHPPANRHIHRDRHSLQRLAEVWLNSFSRECRQFGFSLPEYLEKLAKEDGPSAVRPGGVGT